MLSYLVVKNVEKRFSSIYFLGLEDKIYVVYKNTHTHTPKKKKKYYEAKWSWMDGYIRREFFFFNKKFKYIYLNLAAISSSNHIKMNFEGSLLAATLSNSDYGGVIGDDTNDAVM